MWLIMWYWLHFTLFVYSVCMIIQRNHIFVFINFCVAMTMCYRRYSPLGVYYFMYTKVFLSWCIIIYHYYYYKCDTSTRIINNNYLMLCVCTMQSLLMSWEFTSDSNWSSVCIHDHACMMSVHWGWFPRPSWIDNNNISDHVSDVYLWQLWFMLFKNCQWIVMCTAIV